MSNDTKTRGLAFAKFLSELPPEERERINALNRATAEAEHKEFRERFQAGQCSFCSEALSFFDPDKPCRHWLLKPEGFGKRHFELLAQKYSLGVLENYVRWVANEEAFAKNINDLADEGSGKLVELTVKYKNLQWSFSCGATDLTGHEGGGGDHSRRPHWHFQMYVDGNPFIRYNDFHLPLSEADVGLLEFMRSNPGKVKKRLAGGVGMDELLDERLIEHIIAEARSGETDEDSDNAPIKLDTIVMAEPGKAIKGEDIHKLIQAARTEGVTIASKLKELKGASIQTYVSPGPGVVHQALRSGRKRKRRNRQVRDEDRAWRETLKRSGEEKN